MRGGSLKYARGQLNSGYNPRAYARAYVRTAGLKDVRIDLVILHNDEPHLRRLESLIVQSVLGELIDLNESGRRTRTPTMGIRTSLRAHVRKQDEVANNWEPP
jgi:hypothetical protein